MKLKVGDTVECNDLNDMINSIHDLQMTGVSTDWEPEEVIAGKHILHVTAIECEECMIEEVNGE